MAGVFVDKLKADGQGLWDDLLSMGKIKLLGGILTVIALFLVVSQVMGWFNSDVVLAASVIVSVAAFGVFVYGFYKYQQSKKIQNALANELDQVVSDVANVPSLVQPVTQ